jgi:hypothetical protein
MRVLQDNGWAGKVKFIGFDASEGLLAGLAAARSKRCRAGSGADGVLERGDDGETPAWREGRAAASTPVCTS